MFMKAIAILMLTAGAARADWRVVELDPADWPPEIVPETRSHVSTVSDAGLPDGLVAPGEADIASAWYEAPTRRYGHGILGDAVEAGALVVETAEGARITLTLPESHVFEDRYPRVADLDGDGLAEVIAIRSSLRAGGGVAIYGVREGRLTELAAVPDIGTTNRWLNIAAIADLNGDRLQEIALVQTPHIGGTLRVFAYDGGSLTLLDEAWGFSNHAIGSAEMRLSALRDVNGDGLPDLALPDARRRGLRILTLDGGKLGDLAEIALPGEVATAIAATEAGLVMGLRDGRVVRVEAAGD